MGTVIIPIQLRGDTAANWASVNPVLRQDEIGVERAATLGGPAKLKIGDGSRWNDTPYFGGGATLTLADLAELIGEDPAAIRSALGLGSAALAASSAFDSAGAASAVASDLADHEADTANPHAVTKAQVGLGSADNTADTAKPVSVAQAAADAQVLVDAKAYADAAVVGLYDPRGNYDASSNLYPATGGSGAAGAVLKGDIWRISVTGTLGGEVVGVGDQVVALVDAPGQTAGNWNVHEHNLGYVPEPQQTAASQAEAEAGSGTSIRSWTPQRIWQSIAAKLTLGTWISAATSKTTPGDADSIPLSDNAASNVLKALSWGNVKASIWAAWGALIATGTGKVTPVDADSMAMSDSAASAATKSLTFANLWTWIKGKSDPLYALADATSAATAYTLAPADNGKLIRFSAATTVIVTIDNASLAANFFCGLRQDGAGQVIVVAGTGTLRTEGTAKTRALYSALSVFGVSASTGYVDGSMSAT